MEFIAEKTIIKLVNKHLFIREDLTCSLYNEIIQISRKIQQQTISIQKNEVLIPHFPDINHYLLTGIDLPVIASSGKQTSRKLMVVGSEPLRNWNHFSKYDLSPYDHVAISTPYSLHLNDASQTVYYKIIEHLAQTHQIYLTDLRKIWFAGFERHKLFVESNLHTCFLLDEINLIKPDFIIAFGKNVFDTLSQLIAKNDINIKVYYFIHPSQRTQGADRRNFFEKLAIDTNKFNSISDSSERNIKPYIEYCDKITSS
jgi:hypothetical protein